MRQRGHFKRGLYFLSIEKEMKSITWEWDFCTPQNSISS